MKFSEFYICDKEGKSNCVIRSLCKAFNEKYIDVYNELCSIAKSLNCESYNDVEVFEAYMKRRNTYAIDYGKDLKIKDLNLDNGKYLVFCYDKKEFYHMVSIIDNILYDKNAESLELYVVTIYKEMDKGMKEYFKEDEYWKKHINKKIEEDLWIDNYKEYLSDSGLCLDLGCGIGQYSRIFMKYGYEVISADISNIALEKVKEFNSNVVNLDMREVLPFEDDKFDIVFANLSIHYFSDIDTKKLMNEINRILKKDGLFIGSVNGMQGLEKIKETAKELDYHYYYNKDKYIRLFDKEDVKKYLSIFNILKIDERETTRFNHKKNYIVFIAKKI